MLGSESIWNKSSYVGRIVHMAPFIYTNTNAGRSARIGDNTPDSRLGGEWLYRVATFSILAIWGFFQHERDGMVERTSFTSLETLKLVLAEPVGLAVVWRSSQWWDPSLLSPRHPPVVSCPGQGQVPSGSVLGESHSWSVLCGAEKALCSSLRGCWMVHLPLLHTLFLLEISRRGFKERKRSRREILIPTKCLLFQLKATNFKS